MSVQEASAIVFRVLPRGEDDLLCEMILRHGGRRWGIARSARKSRRRFGSALAALNVLQVHFEEHRSSSLLFLKEATITQPLVRLSEGLHRLGVAFFCAEVVRAMVPEQSPEPAKFDLLRSSLGALNAGDDPDQVRLRFERELLKLAGLEPHLADCLRCHSQPDRYFFVFREGGFFCERCLPAGTPFEEVTAAERERIFTPFLEYCIGKRLKAKELCSIA